MKTVEYGEVINSEETYKEIAEYLKKSTPVLIGWTDEEGTHLDILFTPHACSFGNIQGGVSGEDLFISIMRIGAFGFDRHNEDTSGGYYNEKLATGFSLGSTAFKLADIVNGVKKYLKK